MLAILTTHAIQYQVPLWQALAKDGRVPFEVWYLTSHAIQPSHDREFGSNFAWDLDMLEGYPHRFLKTPPGATPNTFWRCRIAESLPDLFQKTNAKALWVQGWQVAAYWQAAWAAHNTGLEVWLRGESNDLAPVPLWKSALKRAVLGQLFKRIDRFLYIGSANRRLYEHYGVPNERLYDAPYAVDNDRFARQAEAIRNSRFEIRDSWRIPGDAFCVLFCGKFIPKKRPMDIVEAAKLLMHSNPDLKVHLLFAGSGELGPALRAHCQVVFDADAVQRSENRDQRSAVSGQRSSEKKLTSDVRPLTSGVTSDLRPLTSETKPPASFAGFLNQTEVSKAYAAADVLVLPSDYGETWGLVVNEAMASGLPCIISDRCGCAEELGAIAPNVTYRCGNTEELVDRLRVIQSSYLHISHEKAPSCSSFSETLRTIARIYQ